MEIKKGTKCWVTDPDGLGRTPVRVVKTYDDDERFCTVKFLECQWNLKENLLVARKGTVHEVCTANLHKNEV